MKLIKDLESNLLELLSDLAANSDPKLELYSSPAISLSSIADDSPDKPYIALSLISIDFAEDSHADKLDASISCRLDVVTNKSNLHTVLDYLIDSLAFLYVQKIPTAKLVLDSIKFLEESKSASIFRKSTINFTALLSVPSSPKVNVFTFLDCN